MALFWIDLGSHALFWTRRKEFAITGGDTISDLYEGYLVSGGKIVGEAKKYDPYSRFGSIMMYEMDLFGYVLGYVSGDVRLMSETDLRSDDYLRKELEETLYQNWKRRNVSDLMSEYDRMCRNREFFETFCRRIYEDDLEKEKKTDGTNLL